MIDFTVLLYGAFAGAVFAGVVFLKQKTGDNPEAFQIEKALPTICLGAVIGAVASLSGIPVTEASVAAQLVAYGFGTVIFENIGKAVYRTAVRIMALLGAKPQV